MYPGWLILKKCERPVLILSRLLKRPENSYDFHSENSGGFLRSTAHLPRRSAVIILQPEIVQVFKVPSCFNPALFHSLTHSASSARDPSDVPTRRPQRSARLREGFLNSLTRVLVNYPLGFLPQKKLHFYRVKINKQTTSKVR